MTKLNPSSSANRSTPFTVINPVEHARRASAFISRVCTETPSSDTPLSDMAPLQQFAMSLRSHSTAATNSVDQAASASMSAVTMVKVLKSHKLSVHGAHIYHLGIPAIMLLASAYAADKISRKTFFDTLDLFLQHIRRDSDHPKGIKPHHLVALGIPAANAERLPLTNSRLDLVLVAGLFNGVIEIEDFDLLYGPGPKGRFLQRHFPGLPVVPPAPPLDDHFYCDEGELLAKGGWYLRERFSKNIPLMCANLEKSPFHYLSTNHYKLRLVAAETRGISLGNPELFEDYQFAEEAFHDIFHVVEPGYDPAVTWRHDLERFHFVEPKRIDWIPPEPKKAEAGGNRSKPNRTCAELLCNVV
ncbi:hypothetical protein [Cupriavidus sp. UGS-1]|uniref:hypothetical protein n=1 Tax=Cupriavidus sp. UGS-1 TaxID=2899826 RepID=UPI001E564166|nr:hypothetical protein [Cupriavidus sp. UGS-1]MCD9122999.1 hypothetical protein [Cupriavidus sp. UGS-1]